MDYGKEGKKEGGKMRIPKYMSVLAVLILLGASFVPVCSGKVPYYVQRSDYRRIDALAESFKSSSSKKPFSKSIDETVAEVNVYYTYGWGHPIVKDATIKILKNSTNPINVTLKKNQTLELSILLITRIVTHSPEPSLSEDTIRNVSIGKMPEERETMSPLSLEWMWSTLFALIWDIICHLPGIGGITQYVTEKMGIFTVWCIPTGGKSDHYVGNCPSTVTYKHLTCSVTHDYGASPGTIIITIPYTITVYGGKVEDPSAQKPFIHKKGSLKVPLNIRVEDEGSPYASALSSKKEGTTKEEVTDILVHCGNVTVKWKALLLPEIEEDIPSTINFNINLTDETEYVHFIYAVRTALVPPSFKILPTIALYLIKAGETGDYYVATTQSTHLFVLDHTVVAKKGTTKTWRIYVTVYAFPLFAYSKRTIHLTAHFQ